MPEKPQRGRRFRVKPNASDMNAGIREKTAAIPVNHWQSGVLERQGRDASSATSTAPLTDQQAHAEEMSAQHAELRRQLKEMQEELSSKEGLRRGRMLPHHRKQQYTGSVKDGRRIYSCTIASAINGLDTLGLNSSETDDSVIAAIGGVAEFDARGFLDLGKILPYLRDKSLITGLNIQLRSLFLLLDIGGVALLAYGNHAKLISGYEVRDGEIRLGINDPIQDKLQTPRLQDLVEEIVASNERYNIAHIRANPQPVIGRVRSR